MLVFEICLIRTVTCFYDLVNLVNSKIELLLSFQSVNFVTLLLTTYVSPSVMSDTDVRFSKIHVRLMEHLFLFE